MAKLTLTAATESLNQVIAFVDKQLEENNCPMKAQMQIDIAIEEIYVNIAHYAYAPGQGTAAIRVEAGQAPPAVTITFIDSGIPFNPLKKTGPNISLSANEREIGGLGIYMVKKIMDNIQYDYKNGQNILTLYKKLG